MDEDFFDFGFDDDAYSDLSGGSLAVEDISPDDIYGGQMDDLGLTPESGFNWDGESDNFYPETSLDSDQGIQDVPYEDSGFRFYEVPRAEESEYFSLDSGPSKDLNDLRSNSQSWWGGSQSAIKSSIFDVLKSGIAAGGRVAEAEAQSRTSRVLQELGNGKQNSLLNKWLGTTASEFSSTKTGQQIQQEAIKAKVATMLSNPLTWIIVIGLLVIVFFLRKK